MSVKKPYEDFLASKLDRACQLKIGRTSWFSRFNETISKYADESSIHGPRYIAGHVSRSFAPSWSRVLWAIVFLGSVATGISIFLPIWKQFFDKKTVVLHDSVLMNEVEFPAITFCNANRFRRSLVGQHYQKFSPWNNVVKDYATKEESREMCGSRPFYDTVPNFPHNKSKHEALFMDPFTLGANFGFLYQLLVTPTSYQSVQFCTFMGRRLTNAECYASFQNRITNSKYCFTFNPSDSLRSFAPTQIDSDIPDSASSTYPQPLNGLINFSVKNKGKSTSIELLMNVQEYEYCSTYKDCFVGFMALVHSRDVQPIIEELFDDVMELGVGKQITLSVTEETIFRRTESAGMCTSHVDLQFYKHLKEYDLSACHNECILNKIMNLCRCYPTYGPSALYSMKYVEMKDMGMGIIEAFTTMTKQLCSDYNTTCVDSIYSSVNSEESIISDCIQCKVPCFERKYRVFRTETDFPPANAFHLFKNLKHPRINYTAMRSITNATSFNKLTHYLETLDKVTYDSAEDFSDINEVRRNLLNLRLEIKSMSLEVMTETFAVSISELITQLGGAISLFIGASVLSFVEIIFWFALGIRNACKGI